VRRSARAVDTAGWITLECVLVGDEDLNTLWLDYQLGRVGYEDADQTITWRDMGGVVVAKTDARTEAMERLLDEIANS
jgi:hypothetical protein